MKRNYLIWLLLFFTPFWLGLCMLVGPAKISISDLNLDIVQAILYLRLSRVLAGFIVGAALSCSGVVLQALMRNPLAEPYILGVSGGAGLGAALAIVSGISAISILILPVTAFLGGIVTLTIVYFMAWHQRSASIYTLLLSGVIVSSVCASLIMLVISLAPVEGLHSITWWMLGNLQVMSSELLVTSAVIITLGFVGIWSIARQLNALTLGQEMAHYLGVPTRVIVKAALVMATVVTASSVALSGLIGFVGLVVPHIMRTLIGPDHRRLIPASALAGGLFLTLCDALGRMLFAPVEIPVGVITALAGGPFFLILLRKRKRYGWVE